MRRRTLAALSLLASFACLAAVTFGLWTAVRKARSFGVQTPMEFFAALHVAAWVGIAAAALGTLYFFGMAIIIAYRWPPDP
jgi:hypothetical protein